jgi:hypothetical protein
MSFAVSNKLELQTKKKLAICREAIELAGNRSRALHTINGFRRTDEVFISSQGQDRGLTLSQMILVREGSISVAQSAFPKSGRKLQYNLCRHCTCKSYDDINVYEHTQPCRPKITVMHNIVTTRNSTTTTFKYMTFRIS